MAMRRVFVCAVKQPMSFRFFSAVGSNITRVAIIGAGQVGQGCANSFMPTGNYQVKMYDPDQKNRAALEKIGVTWVENLQDILDGDNHDVLITAVPAPPQVRLVMEQEGLLNALRVGALWIDHTTTDPREAKRLHGLARDRGVDSLEAPLTGGYELLVKNNMTTLIGGDPDVFAKHKSILSNYTTTQIRMGDFGAGNVVKVISNQLAAVHQLAAAEGVMMAKTAGVDLEAFFNGIRVSAGNSYVFETEVPLIFNAKYDPGFTQELHCKDLNIGREVHGSNLENKNVTYNDAYKMHALAEEMFLIAKDRYGAEEGSSTPSRLIEDGCDEFNQVEGFQHWTYSVDHVRGGGLGVVHDKTGKKY